MTLGKWVFMFFVLFALQACDRVTEVALDGDDTETSSEVGTDSGSESESDTGSEVDTDGQTDVDTTPETLSFEDQTSAPACETNSMVLQEQRKRPSRAPGSCPSPVNGTCSLKPELGLGVIMEATDVAPDARIVAVAPRGGIVLVLTEHQEGNNRVIRVSSARKGVEDEHGVIEESMELRLDGNSSLVPVALAPWFNGGHGFAVLLCATEGCQLAVGKLLDSSFGFIPLEGGRLPVTAQMNGIMLREGSVESELCVFGDGIYCFTGECWREEIPAGASPKRFLDFESMYEGEAVAVGEGGRWAETAGAQWSDSDPGDGADLYDVAYTNELGFYAVGAGGILRGGSIAPDCSVASEDLLFLSHIEYPEAVVGLTASGMLIHGQGDQETMTNLCFTGDTYAPSLDALMFMGGIATNIVLATPSAVHGRVAEYIE